jgi:hypothetical protein
MRWFNRQVHRFRWWLILRLANGSSVVANIDQVGQCVYLRGEQFVIGDWTFKKPSVVGGAGYIGPNPTMVFPTGRAALQGTPWEL